MDGLRWLLLLFGLLVIAGVYFYSQREKKKDTESADADERIAPSLDGSDLPEAGDEVSFTAPTFGDEEAAPESQAESHPPADDLPQKIVTLRVVARESKAFAGDDLILNMRGIGLRHGKFGIFHRYDGNDESRTIFSAASLVEPGSFDLQNIAEQQIPGISLFLVLPGPVDSVEAFDLMMSAARTLAQSLEGELLDESGSTLSIQRERYLREEIIQYQHSNLVS
jgi:cell division protein ZipA